MKDVSIAIVTRDGKFLLLKRSDTDPSNPGRWALPGGHCDAGEDPIDGLLRELKEETSLESKPIYCIKLHSMPHTKGRTLHFYWVTRSKNDVVLADGEHSEYIWCSANASRMYNPLGETSKALKHIENEMKEI